MRNPPSDSIWLNRKDEDEAEAAGGKRATWDENLDLTNLVGHGVQHAGRQVPTLPVNSGEASALLVECR